MKRFDSIILGYQIDSALTQSTKEYIYFVNSLSSHLSGILKVLSGGAISVEEHTFSEFNNTILDPVLLAMIELEPFRE